MHPGRYAQGINESHLKGNAPMRKTFTSDSGQPGTWFLVAVTLLVGCRQETAEPLLNRDLGSPSGQILLPTRPLRSDASITMNARVELIELVDPEQEEEEAKDDSIKTPAELILTFTDMMGRGEIQEVAGFLINPSQMQYVRPMLTQTMMLFVQRYFDKLQRLLREKHPNEFAGINLVQKFFEATKLDPAPDGSNAVDVTLPKPNGGTMTFRIQLMKAISGQIFDLDLEGGPERMQAFVDDIRAYTKLLESDTLDDKGAKDHLKALYVKGISVVFPDAPEKADFKFEPAEPTEEAAPPAGGAPAEEEAEPAAE
jgi:hypothetical protein